jgi:ribosome biogenesis protein ERB1
MAKWTPKDRPRGHLIPKKFPNLRSVGAYQHSVREAFERCLDLYLCPRVIKRRLNIDPESWVPRLPKTSDMRPFPTTRCIEYEAPIIRCVTPSSDWSHRAQMVSSWQVGIRQLCPYLGSRQASPSQLGSFEGHGRPESRNLRREGSVAKPVVCVERNPSRSHHGLLAVVGSFVMLIATGTADKHDTETTKIGNASSKKADKAVSLSDKQE